MDMKTSNGFTLIEILLALGIMSIATVFLINGIYNIETISNENQQVLEMGKVLQSNMETVLAETDKITADTYFVEDYIVEIILEPYENTSLLTLYLIITNSSGDSIWAGVIYDPDIK